MCLNKNHPLPWLDDRTLLPYQELVDAGFAPSSEYLEKLFKGNFNVFQTPANKRIDDLSNDGKLLQSTLFI